MNGFSSIVDINSEKTFWNIKSKIIRLWQVSNLNQHTLPFSIKMVLMHAEGGIIHASITKTLLYKFKNEILEGKVYSCENLGVPTNCGSYKTTHSTNTNLISITTILFSIWLIFISQSHPICLC